MLLLATNYRVVFDIAKDARPDDMAQGWLVALLIVGTGVLLFGFRRQLPPGLRIVLPAVSIAFGCLGIVALIFHHVAQPSELAAAYRSGKCDVVEGVVTDFHPMPATGHGVESFVVGGKHFQYSDYVHRAGYNQTSSHGGPIHKGARVRIYYLGEDIANLEIDE